VGCSLFLAAVIASAQEKPAPKAPQPPPDQSAAMKEAVRNFLAIGAPPNPEAVKRGQALFVPNCGFCHGSNAGGGNSGPNLIRSVLVLHDKGTGKEIMPVIRNGRPGKGMPSFNFTDDQIHDIAAFLLSRNQAAANRMEYKLLNVVTGDPKLGESYFEAHCASCHSATGDLAHIAAKMDPAALQSRFLYPKSQNVFGSSAPADPRAEVTVAVTLASGQSFSGKLDHIDDFSVSLTDQSGQHHSWLLDSEPGIKVQVNNPLQGHIDLLKQYTDADMHNVLAYLETLK
jgi:mono/diheme cytochrome c family protein